jgi:hypothetical protein
MLARLEENAKTQWEDRKIEQEEIIARMDANIEAALATKEEMWAYRGQRKAEMEEIAAKMEERMTATQAKQKGSLRSLLRQLKYIDGTKNSRGVPRH